MNKTSETLVEKMGAVLSITFNRPHALNAATPAMQRAVTDACDRARNDPTIRAVVLRGRGGSQPAFMAGTDLGEISGLTTREEVERVEAEAEEALAAIESLPVAVVGVLDGPVIGYGALIAACCDLLIAGPHVRFGLPLARKTGTILSTSNLARLQRLLGVRPSRSLLLQSRLVDADQLFRWGAVNEVHASKEALIKRADELARDLAGLSPISIRGTKESLTRLHQGEWAKNDDLVLASYLSDDAHRASEAFATGDTVEWKGR